jgi:hypothetical protein
MTRRSSKKVAQLKPNAYGQHSAHKALGVHREVRSGHVGNSSRRPLTGGASGVIGGRNRPAFKLGGWFSK